MHMPVQLCKQTGQSQQPSRPMQISNQNVTVSPGVLVAAKAARDDEDSEEGRQRHQSTLQIAQGVHSHSRVLAHPGQDCRQELPHCRNCAGAE